jgi:hypothetical protein
MAHAGLAIAGFDLVACRACVYASHRMKRGLGTFLLALFVVGVLAVPALHRVGHAHAGCAGTCRATELVTSAAACPACHMAVQATEVARVDVAAHTADLTVAHAQPPPAPFVATPFSLSRHPSRGPPCQS